MKEKQMVALAKRAIAGDREAFEQLYAAHARSILFHARSLIIDKENYYEVAQDAVIRMYTHIHQLREPAAFRGWMHQIIRTTAALHNRQLLNRGKYVGAVNDEEIFEELKDEDIQSDPEAVAMAKQEGNRLFAILSELPASYREILVQRYYDDLSYKEIAEAQKISVSNVSTRLQRATAAMRKKIKEVDEELIIRSKEDGMKDDGAYTQVLNEEDQVLSDDVVFEGEGSLKASLLSGVAMLTPDNVVEGFIASANVKLVGVGAIATAVSTTAATTTSVVSIISKVVLLALSAMVITFATVVGSTAVNTIDENPSSVEVVTEDIDYGGTVRLVFVDEKGNDSSRNIVEASVVEGTPAAVEVSWSLYHLADVLNADESEEGTLKENATLLMSGGGSTVGSDVFSGLERGYYLLVFTLVDGNGAGAEVKRTFIVA